MCGIAGYVANRALVVSLAPVLTSLQHRGPDDCGIVAWTPGLPLRFVETATLAVQAHAVLFHTRLSVIDVSTASRQPMLAAGGALAIAYNGEVYNYLELRRELEGVGYCFHTNGDTEVVLAAWEHWREEALPKFEGMFALAILDLSQNRLILARDVAGIKPLFYSCDQRGIHFASEAHALAHISGTRSELDDRAVIEFIGFGLTDHNARSLRRGISHFRSGHWAEISLASPAAPQQVAFWRVPARPARGRFKTSVAQVREQLMDTVKLHLRSDVPFGVTLSGGVDSSAILCCARRVLGRGAALDAYFYQADDEAINERKWAEAAAKAGGARLNIVRLDGHTMFSDLERLVRVQDEPFNSSSIYPQYLLFRRMSEDGIKVSLGGQGADELFFGYPKVFERLARLAVRRGAFLQAIRYYLLAVIGEGAAVDHREFWDLVKMRLDVKRIRKLAKTALLGNKRAPWLGLNYQFVKEHAPDLAEQRKPLPRDLGSEIKDLFYTSSLPRLLRYEDRSAMHWSIENRVPFCSKSVVQMAFSLPEAALVSPLGETKRVLREALRGIVPDLILDRREKIGFFTPEAVLLKRHRRFVSQLFNEFPSAWLPQIDFTAVRNAWGDIAEDRAPYRPVVWRWLSLCLWARSVREG